MHAIEHDAAEREFYIQLESDRAFIRYAQPDDRTLDLQHTIVPPQEQGQGLGSTLVEHVFEYARKEGKRIVPSCAFVKHWIGEHDEYRDVLR
jgi:uncharacterized protein